MLDKNDVTSPSTQNVGNVDGGSMETIINAKGLKKKNDPYRGRRRLKSAIESRKKNKSREVCTFFLFITNIFFVGLHY